MKTPDPELRQLVEAWHDDSITPEEILRLEQRLAEEEEARDYLFDIVEIEAALPVAAARNRQKSMSLPRRFASMGWAKLAAMFLAGLFLGALLRNSVAPTPTGRIGAAHGDAPSATVTGMLGVSWEAYPSGGAITFQEASGEAGIGAGLVELTFASGVRTVIEGPATFQVLDGNQMRLSRGRLVADVPKGAEGFTVLYPHGRLVDLGTEFGMEVMPDGRSANFGVFRGEVSLHPRDSSDRSFLLRENDAILAEGSQLTSIPFVREKFTRQLPSREFAWEVSAPPSEPNTLEYDISHLVWKPGRYRVICKWMSGQYGLALHGAELLLDGKQVSQDLHPGFSGLVSLTNANTYELLISPENYRRGQWTLRLHVALDPTAGESGSSAGILLIEDGLALDARPDDFIGTWEYLHNGQICRRSFAADGSAELIIDGVIYGGFHKSRWRVENGALILEIKGDGQSIIREEHLLRDPDTLIFINCPYRNARRIPAAPR